ncbi:cytochrome C biogenesis protein CcdA [Streptomyces spiroverticillatus]|uniref:Cytochrome C biogenesis protein CcdA n=1 Tax=Streptomyces finlayi TaxID=67296 RepID=A0A919C7T1_9ACTN|nr:cytochrome c biogenesis protein CcdA [Streptomyces finlayi]GGZ90099.1 cytochrome C biogenesis protein CcdA [Streptomyces spiroverticillatus]GHC80916.1 cytochrome C biogenesis protein CcdA [Streptomyces finlayi]
MTSVPTGPVVVLAEATDTLQSGALVLALPIALLAGLISFFSPCVLPLVPGYLSYVTGTSGVDLAEQRRGRMVAGASLFVLGFSAVFITGGALFGYIGGTLLNYKDVTNVVLGVLMVLMGLFFMGAFPFLTQREFRFHKKPVAGLVGAPVLGLLFGIGWTPCLGPAIGVISSMAFGQAEPLRGTVLMTVYCLGLGLPFILAAVAFRKALGAFGWVKKHYVWVMRIGGIMMIATGLLLLTGLWDSAVNVVQGWTKDFQVGI